jgi:hypothetical protein
MWIVQFNNAKSGKRSNIYGTFATSELARYFALNNVENDETFEIVYLCRV